MSDNQPPPESRPTMPPFSDSFDPVTALLRAGALDAPSRPGLLGALGRLEVLRVIGSGGMGVVLLARDPKSSQQVAAKVLRPDLIQEPRAVHQFMREARHMKRMAHPGILPVLEVSDRPEGPYFLMPFAEGGSLAQRIRPGQPLDETYILRVGMQIAEALRYAHSRGIIHRDIKPNNVLLDASGRAYLADFGLARTLYNDSIVDVRQSQCEGTAPYLSPRVAAGEAEDTRCDIYSFGAMLYEMLTGRRPYEGRATQHVLNRILAGPPTPIREANPKAPLGLSKIAEHAMARELRDRYASMSDVVADLERSGEAKEPYGPHGRPRLIRARVNRRRFTAATAVTLCAVVLVGLLFLVKGLLRRPLPPPWEPRLSREQVQAAAQAEIEPAIEVDLGGGITMKMVFVPPGKFLMGSPPTEKDSNMSEWPQRAVTIPQGFYLGIHEVTQAQYERVTASNPSYHKGSDLPVERVSWEDASAFCRKITETERREGRLAHPEEYRLPTEAEWEYACRAGTCTPFHTGQTINTGEANFGGGTRTDGEVLRTGPGRGKTTPVGTFDANRWGLYDMHGNLWEWCADWLARYDADPQEPGSPDRRVLRGGSWNDAPGYLRSACRGDAMPWARSYLIGFRCARTIRSAAR